MMNHYQDFINENILDTLIVKAPVVALDSTGEFMLRMMFRLEHYMCTE